MDQRHSGCASKILSAKIADLLVADGMYGKTLFVQTKKIYRYDDILLRSHIAVCMPESISGKKCVRSTKRWVPMHEAIAEPEFPWIPTVVSECVWKSAVQRCADAAYTNNTEYSPYAFVKCFLLPLLHPNGVPSDMAVELLKEWLIGQGVLEKAFFVKRGSVYLFGPDMVLKEEAVTAFAAGRPKVVALKNKVLLDGDIDDAMYRFKAGQTLDECVNIFLQMEKKNQKSTYTYIERLIQRIEKPIYERVPENPNCRTFDRIVVTVGLPVYMFKTRNELKNAVSNHQEEITRRVIKRIQTDKTFEKFGVPIGVLRCSNIFFRQNNTLEYVFELKLPSEEDC